MKSTLVNMTAVLFGITLVASAGVGAVNMITAEPIAQAEQAAKVEALKVVLPPFDQTAPEALTIDDMPITVYTATKGGQVAGYAVESMTKNGFGGAISMMVGFTPDGEVVNVNVLRQAETPGLGTKMADKENVLLGSIQGKKLETMKLVDDKLAVKKDGRDHILARLCRCDQPRLDGLQERSDGYGADRRIVGSDFCGRRFGRGTNQRAGGSGRRAK